MSTTDPDRLAAHDPATDSAALAAIAQRRPDLRPAVAAHPRAYPELIEWIRQQEVGAAPANTAGEAPVPQVGASAPLGSGRSTTERRRRVTTPLLVAAGVLAGAGIAVAAIVLGTSTDDDGDRDVSAQTGGGDEPGSVTPDEGASEEGSVDASESIGDWYTCDPRVIDDVASKPTVAWTATHPFSDPASPHYVAGLDERSGVSFDVRPIGDHQVLVEAGVRANYAEDYEPVGRTLSLLDVSIGEFVWTIDQSAEGSELLSLRDSAPITGTPYVLDYAAMAVVDSAVPAVIAELPVGASVLADHSRFDRCRDVLAVDGDLVFAGGDRIWRAPVDSPDDVRWEVLVSSDGNEPVRVGDHIVVDGSFYSIEDGTLVSELAQPATSDTWWWSIGEAVLRLDGLYGDGVVTIQRVDPGTGAALWRYAASSGLGLLVLTDDAGRGAALAGEAGERVVLDVETGETLSQGTYNADPSSDPVRIGGYFFVGDVSAQQSMWPIDLMTGDDLATIDGESLPELLGLDSRRFVGLDGSSGGIVAIDLHTGIHAWNLPLEEIGDVGTVQAWGGILVAFNSRGGGIVLHGLAD